MAEENKNLDPQKKSADKPQKKQKKANIFVRAGRWIKKWFRELVSESKQVLNNTLIVIVCILVVGVFVWVLDIAFATIRDLFVSIL